MSIVVSQQGKESLTNNSYAKKKSIVRQFLVLTIKNSSVKLCTTDIEKRIFSKLSCRSIIVVRVGEDSLAYKIGVHTTDASKHTYKKVTRALFPEIEERDFEAKAIKGIGSWARSLCNKESKIVSCSGELQTHELFRIADCEKKNKKLNTKKIRIKRSPKKGIKKENKKKKQCP